MLKKVFALVVLAICLMGVAQAQESSVQTWEYATLSYYASSGGSGLNMPSLSFSGTSVPTATPAPPTVSVTITTSNPEADVILNQEAQALLLPMIEGGISPYADPRNIPLVLDYMGRQGWEVVSTTIALSFGGPSGGTYAFVLKRPVL